MPSRLGNATCSPSIRAPLWHTHSDPAYKNFCTALPQDTIALAGNTRASNICLCPFLFTGPMAPFAYETSQVKGGLQQVSPTGRSGGFLKVREKESWGTAQYQEMQRGSSGLLLETLKQSPRKR